MKTDTTNIVIREVTRYDGQNIWTDGSDCAVEIGSYLGGGAAGVVYEGIKISTDENVAVKILNPIGFKLTPSGILQRYLVAVQGQSPPPPQQQQQQQQQQQNGTGARHTTSQYPSQSANQIQLETKHLWWLVHPSTREVLAAFLDPRFSRLREVPLTHCVQIWGWDADINPPAHTGVPLVVKVRGNEVTIPTVPKKFVQFLKERRSIFREIASMSKIRGHENCLKLYDVFELLNDSKSTIFLLLELAMGGELFDRIEIDRGTSEATAHHYFSQLLAGLAHCHGHGVCHRDLKPENLLLSDNEDNPTLKIADFGLSALFRERELSQEDHRLPIGRVTPLQKKNAGGHNQLTTPPKNLVRLKSVVGSPHYVAPEILHGNSFGYEGAKADVWSAGVILYAMLAGNLPFGKEILKCPRFLKWKAWTQYIRKKKDPSLRVLGERIQTEPYPTWFFPSHFSPSAVDFLQGLLEPDAELRLSVQDALRHEWIDPYAKMKEDAHHQPTQNQERSTGSANNIVHVNKMAALTLNDDGSNTNLPTASESIGNHGIGRNFKSEVCVLPTEEQDKQKQAQQDNLLQESSGVSGHSSLSNISMDASDIFALSADELDNEDGDSFNDRGISCLPSSTTSSKRSTRAKGNVPNAVANANASSSVVIASVANHKSRSVKEWSSLSTGSTGSNSSNERKREHVSFSSPPLAPRSVRNIGNAAVSDMTYSGNNYVTQINATASNAMPIPRVNSLEDFSLDGDCAWIPEEGIMQSSWSTPPAARGMQMYHTLIQRQREQARLRQQQQQTTSMMSQSPVLSFISPNGGNNRAIDKTDLNNLEKFLADDGGFSNPALPAYQKIVVQRSTRFSTNVPAAMVIMRIADLVAQDEYPLPPPYAHIRQKVCIDREAYRLEVTRGGILICTVQIFQLDTGQYMVDFLRGQFGIFAFKRFYDDIRHGLQQLIKTDYSRTTQLIDTPPSLNGNRLSETYSLKRSLSTQF